MVKKPTGKKEGEEAVCVCQMSAERGIARITVNRFCRDIPGLCHFCRVYALFLWQYSSFWNYLGII